MESDLLKLKNLSKACTILYVKDEKAILDNIFSLHDLERLY